MKRKTIFISLLLSVAMMMSVMVTNAGAAFTNYAKQTKLFTNYAGYDIHVDDFYNLIKQYVGKNYTYSYSWNTGKIDRKVNWKGLNNCDPVTVVTSKCTMDANGTIQISQYNQYYFGHCWTGVSITKDGNLNMTKSELYEGGECYYDIAWNANTNYGIVYVKDSYVDEDTITFRNTYYGLSHCIKGSYKNYSWDKSNWMSGIIREYNWKSLNYTFYVPLDW